MATLKPSREVRFEYQGDELIARVTHVAYADVDPRARYDCDEGFEITWIDDGGHGSDDRDADNAAIEAFKTSEA